MCHRKDNNTQMKPLVPVLKCLLDFSLKRTLCVLPNFNMSSCANEDYQDGDCVVNNYNSLISAAIASSVPVSGYVNLFRAPMLLTALIRQDFLPS